MHGMTPCEGFQMYRVVPPNLPLLSFSPPILNAATIWMSCSSPPPTTYRTAIAQAMLKKCSAYLLWQVACLNYVKTTQHVDCCTNQLLLLTILFW